MPVNNCFVKGPNYFDCRIKNTLKTSQSYKDTLHRLTLNYNIKN